MTTTPTTTDTTTAPPTESGDGPRLGTIWPCLNYADARAAIAFLTEALGFEETLVVGDGAVVEHAELVWPEGGGVMLGSAGRGESPFSQMPAAAASVYVVTAEPDRVHDRAVAAGARVVQSLHDADYGSRGFTVADPEGNLWSFGTYRGTSRGA